MNSVMIQVQKETNSLKLALLGALFIYAGSLVKVPLFPVPFTLQTQ